jgi:hypothetical protein
VAFLAPRPIIATTRCQSSPHTAFAAWTSARASPSPPRTATPRSRKLRPRRNGPNLGARAEASCRAPERRRCSDGLLAPNGRACSTRPTFGHQARSPAALTAYPAPRRRPRRYSWRGNLDCSQEGLLESPIGSRLTVPGTPRQGCRTEDYGARPHRSLRFGSPNLPVALNRTSSMSRFLGGLSEARLKGAAGPGLGDAGELPTRTSLSL